MRKIFFTFFRVVGCEDKAGHQGRRDAGISGCLDFDILVK